MISNVNSHFSLPPHPDVPFEIHNKCVEHQCATQLAQVRLLQRLAVRRRKTVNRLNEQLPKSLGPDLYKLIASYAATQDELARKRLMQAKDPEELREERKKLQAEREQAGKDFVTEHGIDLTQIQGLIDKIMGDSGEPDETRPNSKAKPVKLGDARDVPARVRSKGTRGITTFTPPFEGWSWYYSWSLLGFEFTPTLFLDSATGLIGNRNSLVAPRNDGGLSGYSEYNSAIAFWYQMPTTGLVRVDIDLESVEGLFNPNLNWDYIFPVSFPWGRISGATYVTLKVDGPTPGAWQHVGWGESYRLVLGAHPDAASRTPYLRGRRVPFTTTSEQSFASGTWVLIHVGCLTLNSCQTHQLFATSQVNFQWLVRSVQVCSTGG